MNTANIKKLIFPNIPYIMMFWFFSIIGKAYRLSIGKDVLTKIMATLPNLPDALSPPLTGHPFDLLIGIVGAAAVYATVYIKKKNAKKWRKEM